MFIQWKSPVTRAILSELLTYPALLLFYIVVVVGSVCRCYCSSISSPSCNCSHLRNASEHASNSSWNNRCLVWLPPLVICYNGSHVLQNLASYATSGSGSLYSNRSLVPNPDTYIRSALWLEVTDTANAVTNLSSLHCCVQRRSTLSDLEDGETPLAEPSGREDLPSAGFRTRNHCPLVRISKKPRFPQLQSFK